MRWLVQIKNGVISKSDLFADYIAKQKDGAYLLTIEKQHAKRSLAQNNFYHGIILPLIADWMGETEIESVCKSLKVKLGYCVVKANKLGQKTYECPSTANWNKPEMSAYLFKIEALMNELTDGQFIFPRGDENNPY